MTEAIWPLMIILEGEDHRESSEIYFGSCTLPSWRQQCGDAMRWELLMFGLERPVFGQSASQCNRNLVLPTSTSSTLLLHSHLAAPQPVSDRAATLTANSPPRLS